MKIDLVIKNYRCFSETNPLKITLETGFTAFVGPNNAGKSTILKFLYEFREIFRILSTASPRKLRAYLTGTSNIEYNSPAGVTDLEALFFNRNQSDISIKILFDEVDQSQIDRALRITNAEIVFQRKNRHVRLYLSSRQGRMSTTHIHGMDAGGYLLTGGQKALFASPLIEALKHLGSTMYIGPFRNIINVGEQINYYDISTGESFVKQWKTLKTGTDRQSRRIAHNLESSLKSIFDYQSLEINASSDETTLQLIINDNPYDLQEMGSGISHFIIVLTNAALKKPSILLIDEPELNLHPTLQLDFLTALGLFAEEGLVFATHSVGLARASAEAIYSVSMTKEGSSIVRPFEETKNLSEFLGAIGFSSYNDLGFKKVLLVEGPTEVKTMQQWLRLYRKEHEIVILPLGGSRLIKADVEDELREITRITEDVSAIIDSERDGEGEPLDSSRTGFQEACASVKIDCHVLERRATENYFTEAAVKRVKGKKYKALDPYQKRGDLEPMWGKRENWKVAREMNLDDLKDTDLGTFLEQL